MDYYFMYCVLVLFGDEWVKVGFLGLRIEKLE